MLEWYRALIQLRRASRALNNAEPGNTRVRFDRQQMGFTMERGDITVVVNLGNSEFRVPLPEGHKVLLGSSEAETVEYGTIAVPADSVVIAAPAPSNRLSTP